MLGMHESAITRLIKLKNHKVEVLKCLHAAAFLYPGIKKMNQVADLHVEIDGRM